MVINKYQVPKLLTLLTLRPLIINLYQGPFIYNEGRIWSKNVRKKEFEVFDLHRNPKPNSNLNRRIVLHSIESQPRWVDQVSVGEILVTKFLELLS